MEASGGAGLQLLRKTHKMSHCIKYWGWQPQWTSGRFFKWAFLSPRGNHGAPAIIINWNRNGCKIPPLSLACVSVSRLDKRASCDVQIAHASTNMFYFRKKLSQFYHMSLLKPHISIPCSLNDKIRSEEGALDYWTVWWIMLPLQSFERGSGFRLWNGSLLSPKRKKNR